MATANKSKGAAAPQLQRRTTAPVTLPEGTAADIVEATNAPNIQLGASEQVDEDTVTVVSPRAFILTRDDHTPVQVPAGVSEMRVSDADHWYAQAQGVQKYKAGK